MKISSGMVHLARAELGGTRGRGEWAMGPEGGRDSPPLPLLAIFRRRVHVLAPFRRAFGPTDARIYFAMRANKFHRWALIIVHHSAFPFSPPTPLYTGIRFKTT